MWTALALKARKPNLSVALIEAGLCGGALGGMGHWNEALTAFDTVESLDPAYPNLKANQEIAQKNLDASTPFYIKNAPMIGGITVVIILVIAWLYAVRKKY